MPSRRSFSLYFLCGAVLAGCSSYHQNIMFQPGENFTGKQIGTDLLIAPTNYTIQVNDYLKLEVYSNRGERIIDPNGALVTQDGPGQPQAQAQPLYLVATDGTIKFPMIDPIRLEGMTIRQAEQTLQQQYDKFYKECFVILSFSNKRVVVLGATGGQVIPLANENVPLTEVLALAKGINNDAKANNIRLIRGEDVFLVDLSTLDGLKGGNMIVQPGDIVYVEPVRRPFAEAFRDFAPFLSFIFSLSTLIVVFMNPK